MRFTGLIYELQNKEVHQCLVLQGMLLCKICKSCRRESLDHTLLSSLYILHCVVKMLVVWGQAADRGSSHQRLRGIERERIRPL